jgi:hypothetical protein
MFYEADLYFDFVAQSMIYFGFAAQSHYMSWLCGANHDIGRGDF